MDTLNIAVIGAGISGLSAAWLLSKHHRVTLYEREGRPGGHANTIDVSTPEATMPVDTGFMVFNERNYPNLTALFRRLDVETRPTNMSFALSVNNGAYEYSGSGLKGFFGQKRNFARPGHWRLLQDVARFFRTAQDRIVEYDPQIGLGQFLTGEGYSRTFIQNHIVPMGAAIWSTPAMGMLDFPARTFIDFYANHGMLQFRHRPQWRTVAGGSRSYVDKLLADARIDVQLANPVRRVVRHPRYVYIEERSGAVRPFDHVVIATHADQAVRILADPDHRETQLLGAFSYQPNRAYLHRDTRWMPRRKRLWSSWNYTMRRTAGDDLCVTYWMNRLQALESRPNMFVTLNPAAPIHAKAIDAVVDYRHPVFDEAAIAAQRDLWSIQGGRRTWFCGSYFGYGFHEDGAQSGLAVAEQLGGMRRPWEVDPGSMRIGLPSQPRIEAAE